MRNGLPKRPTLDTESAQKEKRDIFTIELAPLE
jgi:hypothetical protein